MVRKKRDTKARISPEDAPWCLAAVKVKDRIAIGLVQHFAAVDLRAMVWVLPVVTFVAVRRETVEKRRDRFGGIDSGKALDRSETHTLVTMVVVAS